MRKFRGYCHDGKASGWVYGLLTGQGTLPSGFEYGHIGTALCPKESIGQFTGHIDKNGKEVYEGDVVHREVDGEMFKFYVIWEEHNGRWALVGDDYEPKEHDGFFITSGEIEVVGQRYEA